MMREKNIKFISTINDISNIVNGFFCVCNFAMQKKILLSILFLFSFSVNAQIFVGDSAIVSNNGAILISETNKKEVFTEKSEASIFVSKDAIIVNTEQLANAQIIYENSKLKKSFNQKILAKNSRKTKNNIREIVSAKDKHSKKSVLGYKNNENRSHSFNSSLSEKSVVIPNFNNTKSFFDKDYTRSFSVFNFSEIHINNSLLTVDFHQYFLEGHHNRPPPPLS